jgi:hypothetical protein
MNIAVGILLLDRYDCPVVAQCELLEPMFMNASVPN